MVNAAAIANDVAAVADAWREVRFDELLVSA